MNSANGVQRPGVPINVILDASVTSFLNIERRPFKPTLLFNNKPPYIKYIIK